MNPCPIDCTWTKWSRCNASCGGGKQDRSVEQPALHGGKNCTGPEIQDCNSNPCSIDCTWTEWSSCSATCGQGLQSRMIKDQARNGGNACPGKSTKPCNLSPCPDISKLPRIESKYLLTIVDSFSAWDYKISLLIKNMRICSKICFFQQITRAK